MKKRERKIGSYGNGKNLLLTSIIQPILFLIFTLIFSLIIYNGNDPTSNTALYSVVSLFCAGGVGAFIITKFGGEKGAYYAIFATIFSSLLILIISLISNGKISLGTFMNILCFALISLLFVFLGKYKHTNSHKRKRY